MPIKLDTVVVMRDYLQVTMTTLNGSLKLSREYKTPIYPKPTDLIHVNLGEWKESLNNSRILGRVVGNKLKPYFSSLTFLGALDREAPILSYERMARFPAHSRIRSCRCQMERFIDLATLERMDENIIP